MKNLLRFGERFNTCSSGDEGEECTIAELEPEDATVGSGIESDDLTQGLDVIAPELLS